MFRYGGPIKEGVMSGIREPKRGGGSMGNLVGSPLYPKTKGREHHWAVMALPYIGAGLRMAARPFGRWAMQNVPKMFSGPQRNWAIGKGFSSTPGYTKNVAQNVFTPNKLGKYLLSSPEGRLVTGGAGWAGKAGKSIYAAGKGMAKSPLTMGGLFWMGGKWLTRDGKEATENEIAKASTGKKPWESNEGMKGDGSWFAAQAEKEALAKKQKDWNNRIQKYRDIMDIKGMNKQAAYKSLTDASKLIQESGDFKGDIKSGKLINQVIQAASKQFDKPAKTSDAINTLILQNELKKDLSAETDALDKEYKRGRIAVDKKTLNPSFSDMKVAARKNMDGQSAWDAAAASTSNNFRGNIIPNSEWVKIKKDIKKKSGEVDDITIIANWTTETIKDKNVPDGDYTVGDALVTIQNNQVTNVNR
jgi:hypothetical protein